MLQIDTRRTYIEDICREIEIMKSMNHPRILQIFGHVCCGETAHIFMEWMPGLLNYWMFSEYRLLIIVINFNINYITFSFGVFCCASKNNIVMITW